MLLAVKSGLYLIDNLPNGGEIDQIGALTFSFDGPSGVYDVVMGYFDENDGNAEYQVEKGNILLDTWVADQELQSHYADEASFVNRTVASNLHISNGDSFKILAFADGYEHARIDYIDFIPLNVFQPWNSPTNNAANDASDSTPITSVRVEAEDIDTFYDVENISAASGGKVWSVVRGPSNETGFGSFNFEGQAGTYDIVVGYFDENDGVGQLRLEQGDILLDQWDLDQNLGSSLPDSNTFTTRTVASNAQVNPGDAFKLVGTENSYEFARVDYIDFIAIENAPEISTPLPTIRVESEHLSGAYYGSEAVDGASGGRVRSIIKPNSNEGLTYSFNGQKGLYDVIIGYYDGYGASRLSLEQDNSLLDEWSADQEVSISWKNNFQSRSVATNIEIDQGDIFELKGTLVGSDYLRVDYIDFVPVPVNPVTSSDASSIRFETEDMALDTYGIKTDSGASGRGIYSSR